METSRRKILSTVAILPAAALYGEEKPELPTSSEILRSFDARDWASAFVKHVKAIPAIATDEATMATWFANSLMRGFDEALHRYGPKTTTEDLAREELRGAVARGWCHDVNSHKVMDGDLGEAIVEELMKLRA